MIKEQKITFQTAKLAKEKNYINGSYSCYTEYKKSYNYDNDPKHRESYKAGQIELDHSFYMINNHESDLSCKNYELYEAPTQSLLQKWLRETHQIQLEFNFNFGAYIFKLQKFNENITIDATFKEYATYEEALEIALQEALKLI